MEQGSARGRRRPLVVILAAVLVASTGVLAIAVGLGALDPDPPLALVLLSSLFGAGMIVVAAGLVVLHPAALRAAVAVQALNAAFAAITLLRLPGDAPSWATIGLAATSILLLTRDDVRRAFAGGGEPG